jgi:alpha-glucosidase
LPDHEARNVVAMSNDKASILTLVRSLIHYRRQHTSLLQGEWRLLSRKDDVLAYERRNGENRLIVVLNFTANPRAWSTPASTKVRVAISTHGDRHGEPVGSTLSLRGNEGLLIEPV